MYWPHGQVRNLNDLKMFITDGTLVTGDFNAAYKNWGSPNSDSRGNLLKKWIDENELIFVPSTTKFSKRSERHIDLLFSNLDGVHNETILFGTSDHWPIVTSVRDLGFTSTGSFPHFDTSSYQIILVLLEQFWVNLTEIVTHNEWYQLYIRFLAALKGRLTSWKSKEKYRPSLPTSIVNQIRKVRQIRNRYYRQRKNTGIGDEELRTILRSMAGDVRRDIYKYRTERWSSFLTSIQSSARDSNKVFWTHLSTIYRPRSPTLSKLLVKNVIISNEVEIVDHLQKYFVEESQSPYVDLNNDHDQSIIKEYEEILNTLETTKNEAPIQTTVLEVTRAIKKMKGKKSSGFDQISNSMIKLLSPTYIT